METKFITHIKDLISQLQARIGNNVQIKEGQYGQESEYTHQEILDELTYLLLELDLLANDPKIFLKLFTCNQREIMIKALKGCLSSVSAPNALLPFIDSIKESITPLKSVKKAIMFMELAEAVVMGKFFNELESGPVWKRLTTYWLAGAFAFGAIAVWLGYDSIGVLSNSQGESFSYITTNWFFVRLLALAFLVAAVRFCAGQYTKIKNVSEDYGYKSALLESLRKKNEDE